MEPLPIEIIYIEFHHQINLVYDNNLYTCASIIKMVYTNALCNKMISVGKYLDHWRKVMWNQLMLTVNRLFTEIRSHHGGILKCGKVANRKRGDDTQKSSYILSCI